MPFPVEPLAFHPTNDCAPGHAPVVDREPKALRAWAKAVVPPGETTRITLRFGPHAFRRWDDELAGWTVDAGRYDLLVGASATDIHHVVAVTIG